MQSICKIGHGFILRVKISCPKAARCGTAAGSEAQLIVIVATNMFNPFNPPDRGNGRYSLGNIND